MTNPVRSFVDRFLGRGDAAVTVPALDGALKPNNVLEQAPTGVLVTEPDDIALTPTKLIFSAGRELSEKTAEGTAAIIRTFQTPINAIAVSKGGALAVAHGTRIDIFDAIHAEKPRASANEGAFATVTALAFDDEANVLAAIGSSKNALADWQRDLLTHEKAGALWSINASTGRAKCLANRLAFPNGVIVEPTGTIIVSEAWEKRLIRFDASGKLLGQALEDLPGYPSRITPSPRRGYWLSVFAPRSQLIEFVLREPKYRKAMMAEVQREYWIAPALRSGLSFSEPMQGGALKQMGILKPWAPTRSYGLVIELSGDFVPLRSFHSRAGGKRHGITAAVETGGTLWATSKGGNEVIAITLEREGI